MAKHIVRHPSPAAGKQKPQRKAARQTLPVVKETLSPALVAREDEALAAYAEKRKSRVPAPSLKFGKDDKGAITVDNTHPDPNRGGALLANALGAPDNDFVRGLISQIVNATGKGKDLDEQSSNFMLAAIKGVQPQDEVETMLATQMAAAHMLTMTFARRLNHVDNIPQQDSASNAINKLMRTFATQVEALKRYRTCGEQRVTVQHVNVSDGGQAIVGDVLATPRRREGEG